MRVIKKEIKIGSICIGGNNPIAVQSMLNTDSENKNACVQQALQLQQAGCQIIRVSVPTQKSVETVYAMKEHLHIPVVADIHFDYKLALESIAAGVDKVRINPGNIGDDSRVKAVADACRSNKVPIRIGVNSGSLEKHILAKYGSPVPEAL